MRTFNLLYIECICWLAEVTVEQVLQNIFASCDPENIGVVSVSKLIEFIKPFMKQSL